MCLLFIAFMPETAALAWHLRHPHGVVVADKHISVPLLSPASYDTDSLGVFVGAGWFRTRVLGRRGWGMMTFSRQAVPHSKEEQQAVEKKFESLSGMHITRTEEIQAGADRLYCRHVAPAENLPSHSIMCFPESGHLSASYFGDQQSVSGFYEILRTVQ